MSKEVEGVETRGRARKASRSRDILSALEDRSIVFEGGHLAQPNWPNQTGPVIGEIKSPSQEPDRNGKCSRRYNYGILEF